MNIKCALLGHDWLVHASKETDADVNRTVIAIALSIISVLLLAPLFTRMGWIFGDTEDATCSRCKKVKFDYTDYADKKEARYQKENKLSRRHDRLGKMRAKARG